MTAAVAYWLVSSVACSASCRVLSPGLLSHVIHLLLVLPCILSPADADDCHSFSFSSSMSSVVPSTRKQVEHKLTRELTA